MAVLHYESCCLRVNCHSTIVLFSLQNSNLHTEVPKENTIPSPHPELTALPVENHCNWAENGTDSPASPLPTIVISQFDSPPQMLEEAEVNSVAPHENCSQDKSEDSDNPLTSHFKMIIKGLGRSRSQESLSSTKTSDEDPSDSSPHQEGTEGLSWLSFSAKSVKKEKICFKMSGGLNKAKGKETQGTLQRGEDSQRQKGQVSWEQLEATKAIFDLLKEISGLFSLSSQTALSCELNLFQTTPQLLILIFPGVLTAYCFTASKKKSACRDLKLA